MNALSNTFSPLLNHKIDIQTEVLVTIGAYGSLFCAMQGLVNTGDEVCCHQKFNFITWLSSEQVVQSGLS